MPTLPVRTIIELCEFACNLTVSYRWKECRVYFHKFIILRLPYRSAQFEHTILITDTGFEVLTASPDENYEILSEDEDEDEDDDDDEDEDDADDKIRTPTMPTSSSSTSEHRPKSPNSAKDDDNTTERHKNTSDWKFDR